MMKNGFSHKLNITSCQTNSGYGPSVAHWRLSANKRELEFMGVRLMRRSEGVLRHVVWSPHGTQEIHTRQLEASVTLSVEPGDTTAASFNQKGNHAEITAEQPLINKSVLYKEVKDW